MHGPRARTDDDIVADIVRLLDSRLPCEEVKSVVAKQLMMQRELIAKIYGRNAVSKRRAAAKRLRSDIERLVASMKAAPSDIVMLMPPELPKIPEEIDQVIATARPRLDAFYDHLVDLSHACQRVMGESAVYDNCKRRCAESAHDLILQFSERSPTNYDGSPFRTITSRIFEYVTGKRDNDLERSCEAVLQWWRDYTR
jgi:hypothetical protein